MLLKTYVPVLLSLRGRAYGGPQWCYAVYAVPAIPDNKYRLGEILRPTRVESKLTENTVLDSEIIQV